MAEIVKELSLLQSDYQVFYQKLRSYHWTVTGPYFFGLHQQFETMYTEVAEQIDAIAERTLSLGGKPVRTLGEQLKLARLSEDGASVDAQQMVRNLREDLRRLNQELRRVSKGAAEAGDVGTTNLLDSMADTQEKTAWMLAAFGG